jgi:hypothetical protein
MVHLINQFMNKKIIVLSVIFLLLAGITIIAAVLINRAKTPPDTGVNSASLAASKTTEVLTWTDPAGFSFSYPSGLTIDKHDEDMDNYAHVELKDAANPGNIIVWAKDTTAVDTAAWVSTTAEYQGANIMDSTMGGQSAKKIIISTPAKKMITGTVYDELLWTIEGNFENSDFWTKIYNTVLDSYQFTPLEDAAGNTGNDVIQESFDEEEVLQ